MLRQAFIHFLQRLNFSEVIPNTLLRRSTTFVEREIKVKIAMDMFNLKLCVRSVIDRFLKKSIIKFSDSYVFGSM